eukprot:10573062-Lingulodinium_polyedra.AAC.1
MPAARDMEALLAVLRERRQPRLALAFDVRKAHRLIPARAEDQGLQACVVDEDRRRVWVNLVGTFGVGSAGY